MVKYSLTISELRERIKVIVRRLSNATILTRQQLIAIGDAINEAIIDLSTERATDIKVVTTDVTVTTTANQNYVDLASGVIGVSSGTVRIISERVILSRIDLDQFYALDVEETATGVPTVYAIDSSGTADVIRMRLRDIPDSAYTVNMTVSTIPDDDSISTMSSYMHGMLASLATSIALESLGFPIEAIPYQNRYEERLKNYVSQQKGDSGPIHIRRQSQGARLRDPQSRARL